MGTRWVWVDFENTPHVLFLEPIIRHLERRGCDVRTTARPQAQTLEVAQDRGIPVRAIGAGDLRTLGGKVVGILARAGSLIAWLSRQGKPELLVSCSRSASLTAFLLRIPGVGLLDYEHAEQRVLAAANRVLWFPDLLRDVALPRATRRIARFYAGLKENLYLDNWPLDRAAGRRALGVGNGDFVVVSRPPAETAHYASDRSLQLWMAATRALQGRTGTRILVAARTVTQRNQLSGTLGERSDVEFLPRAVSGPGLVGSADLVISGGGTMNREAAVLGVPVWSVFTGPAPYVDERLEAEGRLRRIRTEAELADAVAAPRALPGPRRGPFPGGLAAIARGIDERLRVGNQSGL